MVLDFYNITDNGPKAKDYLIGPEVKGTHAIGMAEHHVPRKGIKAARNWCQQAGWRSTWSAAKASGRSDKGTSGGTAVLSKKHLHLSPARIGLEKEDTLEHHGPDWSAIVIKVGGISVLYLCAYFDCGIGVAGDNISKMASIMDFVKSSGLEFIMMADFNMTPDILSFSGWAQKLGGEILIPSNVESTCSTGRMLDYAVVSLKLKEAILSFEALRNVPWKSHMGLRMRLGMAPRSATARTMFVPKPIEVKVEEEGKDTLEAQDEEELVEGEDEDDQECEVRGSVEAIEGTSASDFSFTILSVTIDVSQITSDNDFEGANGLPIGRQAFFDQLSVGDVVEAESDEGGLGCEDGRLTAQEVQFELEDGVVGSTPPPADGGDDGGNSGGTGAQELTGTPGNVGDNSFELGGTVITVTGSTLIDDSIIERALGREFNGDDQRFDQLPAGLTLPDLLTGEFAIVVRATADNVALSIEDL